MERASRMLCGVTMLEVSAENAGWAIVVNPVTVARAICDNVVRRSRDILRGGIINFDAGSLLLSVN